MGGCDDNGAGGRFCFVRGRGTGGRAQAGLGMLGCLRRRIVRLAEQ